MIDSSPLQRENRSTVGSSALAARRWFLVLAPVLAGLLAVGGAVADPAMDLEGEAMYAVYAGNPDPLQWKSVLYHFSYAVLAMAALMLAAAVRQRGSWLANVAGLLGLLGISSIPGFLIIDFYDSAIGQEFGVEGALAVERTMEPMWGIAGLGIGVMVVGANVLGWSLMTLGFAVLSSELLRGLRAGAVGAAGVQEETPHAAPSGV